MKRFSKILSLYFFVLLGAMSCFSGNPKKLDSLYTIVKTAKSDTVKVNAQLKIANTLMKEDSVKGTHELKKAVYLINTLRDKLFAIKAIDKAGKICYANALDQTAKYYWQLGISMAKEQNNKEWQAKLYSRIADLFIHDDLSKQAIAYYDSALMVAKTVGEKTLADIYSRKGRAHYDVGDYKLAMDNYIQAQHIYEKNGFLDVEYGHLLHFIGSVFKRQNFDAKALEYYEKELKLAIQLGNKNLGAEALYLCASQYGVLGDLDKEVDYQQKALKLYQEEGNDRMVALMYGNISNNYTDRKEYKKAIGYCEEALAIYERIGDSEQESWLYRALGDNYSRIGEHKKALEYLKKALAVTAKIETKQLLYTADITNSLAFAYSRMGDYKEAFETLLRHRHLNDSLINRDNTAYLHTLETQYETGKKEKEIALLSKDKQMQHAEIVKQQTQRNALIVGCVLIFIIAGISIVAFINKRKTSRLLTAQVNEIEYQNAVIKEKNKDITDSIQYAKRLQEAVFPEADILNTYFAESFVLFRPKDIVSGDFYWFATVESNGQQTQNPKPETSNLRTETSNPELQILVVGDCTGHGVPGAFMSILGHNLLNQIILEDKVTDPAAILRFLDSQVTNALNKRGTKKEYNDGMDIAICVVNKATMKLDFAGANRPLVIKRGSELIELKPNKFAIGGHQDDSCKLFLKQQVSIKADDVLYLFSDGYIDQFGGPKGKKFKYKQLMQIIGDMTAPLKEQETILDSTLVNWRGDLEQIDDVCVVGVKI